MLHPMAEEKNLGALASTMTMSERSERDRDSEHSTGENTLQEHDVAASEIYEQEKSTPQIPPVQHDKSPETVAEEEAAPVLLSEPPDGGFVAWLQVGCAACTFFNTWGQLSSYGAFQAYYSTELLHGVSDSDISWIGTIQSCFILVGSIYSGPLFDWGYLRALIATGSLMIVVGMFLTSLCREYWQIILAQGLFMGIGFGFIFAPTSGIIATYFSKRRALATGIASSGSTIGGIVYPIILNKLVSPLGFGWTVRVMGFIMLGTLILPNVAMRQRIKSTSTRRVFDKAAWSDAEFTLFAISIFIGYIGIYVPYFYIQLYSSQLGIVRGDLNFYLLPILNFGNLLGRVVLGQLADTIGSMNTYNISGAACTVLALGWMGIHSEAGIIVFVLLYGFASAAMMSLVPALVAKSLCPDMRQYGVRLTMQLVPSAGGLLIGTPIAGAILPHGWRALQGFTAATLVVGTGFGVAAKVAKAGWRGLV